MKNLIIGFMVMMLTVSLFSQQLSYRFANEALTNGGTTMEFDIEVMCDIPGVFLANHTVAFDYGALGFGSNIVPGSVIVEKGTLLIGEFAGIQFYDLAGVANTFPNTMSASCLTNWGAGAPSSMFFNEVPTTWGQFMHFTINIADNTQLAEIAFSEFLMNGQQYYQAGAGTQAPCVDPNLYNNDLLTFPLGAVPTSIVWNGSESDEWFNGNNWNGGSFPTNSDDVEIPSGTANDPVIRDYANVKSIINNATITIDPAALGFNAAALIMNNGGVLENNGSIVLWSVYDPGFPPILPSGTFLGQVVPDPVGGLTGTGTYDVQRYMNITTSGNPNYDGWHYLSSPVDGFDTESIYNFFLNTWDETTGMFNHIEGPAPCSPVTPPLAIDKMQGWSLKEDLNWASYNCPGGTEDVIEMIGNAWNAPFEIAVTNTPTGTFQGFNLVGNPFLCGLDLLSVDWTVANANIDPTAYVYQEEIQNYITMSGVTPDPFAGNTIPSTLGFYVMANTAGNFNLDGSEQILAFGAISKAKANNALIVKASSSSSFDIMRIYFNEEATPGYDRMWDAYKLFSNADGVPQIYTPAGEDMLATNAIQATNMVPMSFKAATVGNYTIEAIETSDFSEVYLQDLVTGVITDLLSDSYTFDYLVGENAERFIIHFGPLGTPEFDANSVKIWSNEHMIYVQAPNINGEIVVINLMGQEMARKDVDPGTNVIPMNEVNTYYVVKVITSENAVTGKVYIK